MLLLLLLLLLLLCLSRYFMSIVALCGLWFLLLCAIVPWSEQSHKFNLDNKLYGSLEPLLPATKEEILKAQQQFCEEAKDTASMSTYAAPVADNKADGGAGAADAAAAAGAAELDGGGAGAGDGAGSGASTDSGAGAGAAAPAAALAGAAALATTTAVRRRANPAAAGAAATVAAATDGGAPAAVVQNNASSSCGMLGMLTCALVLILVVLFVRKFNKTNVL